MKKLHTSTILALLLSLALLTVLMGCGRSSQAPVAVGYKASGQPKMQASEHWRSIAIEVADRVLLAYGDRPDIQERPIFVYPPNNRPFTVAFYNLLRTELVSRGMQVSYDREKCSAVIEYTVQTIPFNNKRLASTSSKSKVTPSNNEIIVNARMFYQNRFVMHCSAIRYINDADWSHYIDPQIQDPMSESTRNIRVSDR